EELAEKQKAADEKMREHWQAVDGILVFDGKGDNICTAKQYGDFELLVDWKIKPRGTAASISVARRRCRSGIPTIRRSSRTATTRARDRCGTTRRTSGSPWCGPTTRSASGTRSASRWWARR